MKLYPLRMVLLNEACISRVVLLVFPGFTMPSCRFPLMVVSSKIDI